MSQFPRHSKDPALELAEERIKFPSTRSFEYVVGTWACTMLCKCFTHGFLITPERFTRGTNKKPDFTIEKLDRNEPNGSKYHAVYELKKREGEYFDDALTQAADAIREVCDISGGSIEMFVIIQRGLQSGFFEYLSYVDLMEKKGIPHFKGCVPLTYLHENLVFDNKEAQSAIEKLSSNLPEEVLTLVYGQPNRKSTDSTVEADEIQTPCIFDLDYHKEEIDFLFHYIATYKARSLEE